MSAHGGHVKALKFQHLEHFLAAYLSMAESIVEVLTLVLTGQLSLVQLLLKRLHQPLLLSLVGCQAVVSACNCTAGHASRSMSCDAAFAQETSAPAAVPHHHMLIYA